MGSHWQKKISVGASLGNRLNLYGTILSADPFCLVLPEKNNKRTDILTSINLYGLLPVRPRTEK